MDLKGGAYVYQDGKTDIEDECLENGLLESFLMDIARLLNAFLESIPNHGNRPSAYYHPAAIVDSCGNNEHSIAVPDVCIMARVDELDYCNRYNAWFLVERPNIDTSSFRSLLPDLKYNIRYRCIDRQAGTTNLTTVISSALLFYRLICKYTDAKHYGHPEMNQVNPITSVWQILLVHRRTWARVIFIDDYGLFDIRADENAMKVMNDIELLVEGLCDDICRHPYDNVLAGTVA